MSMYFGIYIVIGIVAVIAIFFMITKKSGSSDTKIINDDKGKKTQFNPEKVSGLMPNKKKSEVRKSSE